MKPFIQIALSTGHVYEVPTEVIAQNRAKTMQELHPSEFPTLEDALADTRELFDDGYQIEDWAKNNMNPPEYLPSARLIRFITPEQDFSNSAEWSFHDAPAMMGELTGDDILRQPIEAVLSVLGASQQICNVTVLNDNEGKPFAAMALIQGPEPVINAFVTALQFTAERVAAATQPAITH